MPWIVRTVYSLFLIAALSACDPGGPALPSARPLAFYPFEAGAVDASGNGNDGTVVGATPTRDRFGEEGAALAFDGVDDYVVVPHAPTLDLGGTYPSYSVVLWVRSTGPRRSRIVQKWDELRSTPYPFSIRAEPSTLNGAVFDTNRIVDKSTPISWDGTWHHVAFVVDGVQDTTAMYLDGVLVTTEAITQVDPLSNEASFYIGGGVGASNRYFRGAIDDLAVYGDVLTRAEVERLYRQR